MIVTGHIPDDWEQWNEREPNDQWQILENAGFITPRPAPGVADEGNTSDDGALGREEFIVGSVSRTSATSPVIPPSTKARPRMPYEATPLVSDPTSSGPSGEAMLQKIPEKPVDAKPKPPVAPWIAKVESREYENGKKAEGDRNPCSSQAMKETSSATASVVSQVPAGYSQESMRCFGEGSQVMCLGRYPGATYNEAWIWICAGKINVNILLNWYDMVDLKVLNFMNWIHRMRQVVV